MIKSLLLKRNIWNHVIKRKEMSSGLFKNIDTYQLFYNKSYKYKQDLALNNPQRLICYKTSKPSKTCNPLYWVSSYQLQGKINWYFFEVGIWQYPFAHPPRTYQLLWRILSWPVIHLVVPIGVSHISLWPQEIQRREREKKIKEQTNNMGLG